MDEKTYLNKHFRLSCKHEDDQIIVNKDFNSDHLNILMKIHSDTHGRIEIRSKEQAEQLHFMLGQLLEK